MTIRGSSGYVVVNNSQKIEIIDLATNLNTGTISTGSGSSPGPMAFVNDTLALVTDLYANALILVNVPGRRVTGAIAVGANPAGIAITQGKAYVSNSGFGSGRTVSVVSLQSLSVIRTVAVADNPSGVEVTPSGAVYVVCAGAYDYTNPANSTPARIMVIDPLSDVVTDSIIHRGTRNGYRDRRRRHRVCPLNHGGVPGGYARSQGDRRIQGGVVSCGGG
jgi:DNA-binding beta-propeller fold protein YncE